MARRIIRYKLHFYILLLLFITGISGMTKAEAGETVLVHDLSCDMLQNPIGIDDTHPRLSWQLVTTDLNQRGIMQVAYQILVASTKESLEKNNGDIWNSQKISSDSSIQVSYKGMTLKSRMRCYWKVRVWTNVSNVPSQWSETGSWSMGLLTPSDWTGKWIGWDHPFKWDSITKYARLSARYFRKDFQATKAIQRANIYIAGLGLYELYINGQKIGDQVLAPAPTDYSQSVLYNSFDITDQIRNGENTIGVVLGNGRFFTMRQNYKPKKWHNFGFPKLKCQLEIVYDDGSHQIISSGTDWRFSANGPIRSNNEYDGEDYDATKEFSGWRLPGFKSSLWINAAIVSAPGGIMKAQMNPPMRIMERIQPKVIVSKTDSSFILDLGQNMAGWLAMQLDGQGHKGETITLRYAESLQKDGNLYTANLRQALVTDHYTIKGDSQESWSPHFVYHGFRYVEIKNYPQEPLLKNFEADVIYDQMQTIGQFECSDTTINQVFRNAYWGIRSNYKGMPVDCPQRDERQPWLGDRATGAYGESFLFANGRLYAKWLNDIQQSQKPNGSLPDVAPNFWYYYKDDVSWPSTYLFIADMMYHQYGDKRALSQHYSSMRKWILYMQKSYMKNYLISKDSYGDWCVPPESAQLIHSQDSTRITKGDLIASAIFYHDLKLMQKFADLLGNRKDADYYMGLAENMKTAFQNTYYNNSIKSYSNHTITANLLPIAFGIAPKEDIKKIMDNIIYTIAHQFNGHIGTGVIGSQWLMRTLSDKGYGELATHIASNRDYPSWGYMVANGATTIWELWNGNTANPKMNSQNHVMLLGDLLIWLFENQGAIRSDTVEVAFKKIIMKPDINSGLQFVRASYKSQYGDIKSFWNKSKDRFNWQMTIPINTNADLYIPCNGKTEDALLESGKPVQGQSGLKILGRSLHYIHVQVGSGHYSFSSRVK